MTRTKAFNDGVTDKENKQIQNSSNSLSSHSCFVSDYSSRENTDTRRPRDKNSRPVQTSETQKRSRDVLNSTLYSTYVNDTFNDLRFKKELLREFVIFIATNRDKFHVSQVQEGFFSDENIDPLISGYCAYIKEKRVRILNKFSHIDNAYKNLMKEQIVSFFSLENNFYLLKLPLMQDVFAGSRLSRYSIATKAEEEKDAFDPEKSRILHTLPHVILNINFGRIPLKKLPFATNKYQGKNKISYAYIATMFYRKRIFPKQQYLKDYGYVTHSVLTLAFERDKNQRLAAKHLFFKPYSGEKTGFLGEEYVSANEQLSTDRIRDYLGKISYSSLYKKLVEKIIDFDTSIAPRLGDSCILGFVPSDEDSIDALLVGKLPDYCTIDLPKILLYNPACIEAAITQQ